MAKNVKDAEWLDRSLFISSHCFTLCTNERQYKKILKQLNIPKSERPPFMLNWHSNAAAHHFENCKDMKASVVVCLGSTEGRDLIQIYTLLVHEAVHIWQKIRQIYGEHTPSPELEAYAIQNLSQQLMYEYERQTK